MSIIYGPIPSWRLGRSLGIDLFYHTLNLRQVYKPGRNLYPKLREANALVIAGPIYWFTVSAQTKLFIDRCYALHTPQGNALKGKRIGIVLTYGGSDPFNSGAVNALRTFQDIFNYIGADIVGMVYGSASDPGEIKSNNTLMDEAYQLGKKLVTGA